jgi:hypothetical protein
MAIEINPPNAPKNRNKLSYDEAVGRVQNLAKSHLGRELDQNELTQLGSRIGYSGGDVDEGMLGRAGEVIYSFAKPQQPKPQAPPAAGGGSNSQPAPQRQGGGGNDQPQQVNGRSPEIAKIAPTVQQLTGAPIDPGGQAIQAQVASRPMLATGGQRIDPNLTGTTQQAVEYLQAQAQRLLGAPLSQDQLNQLAQRLGYSGGQVTGAMVNQALGVLEGWADTRAIPQGGQPTPTPGGPAAPAGGGVPNSNVQLPGTSQSEFKATPWTPTNPLAQWQAPDNSGIEAMLQQRLNELLTNPYSLSDQTAAALKEKSKEEALFMEEQQRQQLAQGAARRGMTGAGSVQAAQRDLAAATREGVVRGNREVDIIKAQSDKGDLIRAIGAADATLGSQFGRSLAGYDATLKGQMAENDRLGNDWVRKDQSDFRNWAANDAQGFRNWSAQQDLAMQMLQQQLADRLGTGNLDLANKQFGEGQRQFDIAQELARKQFEEMVRQFNTDWMNRFKLTQFQANQVPNLL